MDELRNQKNYLEYQAEKELAQEAAREPVVQKELTMGERIRRSLVHFWTYYKWYVIIPLICIVVVGSLAYTIITNNTKPFFSMVLVNSAATNESKFNEVVSEFNEYIHQNDLAPLNKEMSYKDSYRHPLKSDGEYVLDTDINGSTQRLSSELNNNLVDIVLMNTRCADEYCESGCIASLEEILTTEELSMIAEENYYYGEVNEKKQIIGIRVEAFSQLSDLEYREGDEYLLVVSSASSQKEMAHIFIKYLIED